ERGAVMTHSGDALPAASSETVQGPIGKILRARELVLVLALLVICVLVSLREPRFLDPTNLYQVMLSATLVCIVSVGQAMVIIARQIDLSVGAIVAMSAFVSTEWLSAN